VFATNLRRLRHAKGLSQDDLVYDAEVSRSYLSQLEKGVFFASLRIVGRLADALNVEPAELLRLPQKARAPEMMEPCTAIEGYVFRRRPANFRGASSSACRNTARSPARKGARRPATASCRAVSYRAYPRPRPIRPPSPP
jgi:transcriptional regulator with XRE-family HTH domain